MEHKIIFSGQVGAGKSAAIQAISDIDVVSTEARASDGVALRKMTTTVGMDYGTLKLDDGQRVHLYGTPGQSRFSFMWDIITEGGLGLVLLVDNSAPDPLADLAFYLDAFNDFIRKSGVAIGVTRMDEKTLPSLQEYQLLLDRLDIVAPLLEVDARDPKDVKVLVQNLIVSLEVRC